MVRISTALAAVICFVAPSGTGVLAGRVVDAATELPIAGAAVSLHQWRGDGFASLKTTSDNTGGFSFTGLGVGSFGVTATAGASYLGGAVGQRRPLGDEVWVTLAANERRQDLTIEMFRSASVSGRVVDENDQPVAVSVEAWPRSSHPTLGRREPPIRFGSVDSGGTFRINGLVPGDYVVVVPVAHHTLREAPPQTGCAPAPPSGFQPAPPERPIGTLYLQLFPRGLPRPKPLADGTPTTYRTTFFPGVADVREAATITLRSGESRTGIEFQLQSAVATTVRGELTTGKALRGGDVHLRLAGSPRSIDGEARTWLEPGSGSFTLLDVPMGSYVLDPVRYSDRPSCDVILLDNESSLTHVPIEVPASGVNDLVVPLAKGVTVTGSIVLHGGSQPPQPLSVALPSLATWSESRAIDGYVENLGLHVAGVTPGLHEMHVINDSRAPSWWLDRVTLEGQDVSGLPMAVGPGGLTDVVVTMTDRPSKVAGAVRTTTNEPVADATVVLFPVDRTLWPNARVGALRFQTTRALRGLYEFADVLAGDYYLAAVDETTMDAWPSADFLGHIASAATRVTVVRETPQTIALTMKR